MFLKNKNIIFKSRRSKVTDYAALTCMNRLIWVSALENLTFFDHFDALFYSKKIPFVRFVFLENDEN